MRDNAAPTRTAGPTRIFIFFHGGPPIVLIWTSNKFRQSREHGFCTPRCHITYLYFYGRGGENGIHCVIIKPALVILSAKCDKAPVRVGVGAVEVAVEFGGVEPVAELSWYGDKHHPEYITLTSMRVHR